MTTPREALRLLVDQLEDGQVVSVPVAWARELLADATTGEHPELLTVADLAQHYGRAESTVRGWLEAGRFATAFKIEGRDWRVPRDGLAAFDEGQRNSGVRDADPPRTTEATQRRRSTADGKLGAWRSVARGE